MKRRAGQNEGLVRLSAMIQWRPLERALAAVYNANEGRPSYPPLVMFKCLLLQQWYTLSDPQLEEALADRLSFRRFVGLPLDEEVPDYSTISRFRAQLAQLHLGERLFAELNRQLAGRGLLVKQGTMLDATLIEASVKPVRGARSARLAQLGITDGIMRKLMPHSRDPHPVLAARNRRLARIRGAVERKFAVLKEHYRCRRVRYRGLLKNQLHLLLICFAMNLKRAHVLRAAG
ncbi:MAG: transposase [Terriglobales bacterium]